MYTCNYFTNPDGKGNKLSVSNTKAFTLNDNYFIITWFSLTDMSTWVMPYPRIQAT